MKNIISAFAVLLATNSFAAGATANLFHCVGEENTEISFSSTSFAGAPQLAVKFRGIDAKIDSGTGVKVQNSLIGTLATVQDSHLTMVDGPAVRYTLVVPHVQMGENNQPENFSTFAIRTSVANPFFRPMNTPMVSENNEVLAVECTAQAVQF